MSDSCTSDFHLQNQCVICKISFSRKSDLYRHLRVQHKNQGINDPMVVAKINCKFSCPTCHRKFSRASNLTLHIRTQHPEIQTVQQQRKSRLICPADNCKEFFTTYDLLREHLSTVHDFSLTKETLKFESESEFKEWKMNYEKCSGTSYVSNTGSKKMNGSTRTYYYCHCSYSYKPRGKNIRKIKSAGSKRVGTACPSTMNVVKTSDIINVDFWKNHFNCNSTGHIFLSKRERAQIAAKLQQGVSLERIIDDFRNENKEEGLQRMHLLKRKDLHNIRRDHKYLSGEMKSIVSASGSNTNPPKGTNKITLLAQQVIALSGGVSENVEREVCKGLLRIIQKLNK